MKTKRIFGNFVAIVSSSAVTMLLGCAPQVQERGKFYRAAAEPDDVIKVKAAVFKYLGDHSGKIECVLDVSASEFRIIERELAAGSSKPNLARATEADPESGRTVLVAKIVTLGADNATALGSYVSKHSFSRFRFRLVRQGAAWTVESCEFEMAS